MKVEKHVRVKCPFCKQWVNTTANGTVIAAHEYITSGTARVTVYRDNSAWSITNAVKCEGSYKSIVELEAIEVTATE